MLQELDAKNAKLSSGSFAKVTLLHWLPCQSFELDPEQNLFEFIVQSIAQQNLKVFESLLLGSLKSTICPFSFLPCLP